LTGDCTFGFRCTDVNAIGDVFPGQIVSGGERRCETKVGDMTRENAVDLLGKGRVLVTAAQSGFDMANGDLLVEGRKGAGEGGGVALDQGEVRADLAQHPLRGRRGSPQLHRIRSGPVEWRFIKFGKYARPYLADARCRIHRHFRFPRVSRLLWAPARAQPCPEHRLRLAAVTGN
jgi:hypothetical protein